MNNSTIGAAVSMASLQQRLDLIADNIANVNTAGYKSKEGSFEDVLTRCSSRRRSTSWRDALCRWGLISATGCGFPRSPRAGSRERLRKPAIRAIWRYKETACSPFK